MAETSLFNRFCSAVSVRRTDWKTVALCLYLSVPTALVAQVPAERRLAFVVGNNAYQSAPLKNAVNDAIAIETALNACGFKVFRHLDVDAQALERAIDEFVNGLRDSDVVLLYYSGHGIQIDGENYIIPTSFRATSEADAKHNAYSIDHLLDRIGEHRPKLTIVILDSCRSNPFRSFRSSASGWAPMQSAGGTFIAFATAPGNTASDNPTGKNGLFTSHLLPALEHPGWTLDEVFGWVRKNVYSASKGRQLPWTASSVIGDFWFLPQRSARGVDRRNNKESYTEAVRSLSTGRFEEAATTFEAISRSAGERQWETAREQFATLLSPRTPAPADTRSLGVFPTAMSANAIRALSAAIERTSGDPIPRSRVKALLLAGRNMEAIADLVLGGGAQRSSEGECLLSMAYLRQFMFDESYAAAERAVLLSPNSMMAQCIRANAEFASGRLERANQHVNSCVDVLDPAVLYRMRGHILSSLGRSSEAARMYELAARQVQAKRE